MGQLKQLRIAFCCTSDSGSSSTTPKSFAPSRITDSEHIVKLNESLYQLYKPTSTMSHNMQVLFFHGLQFGDYKDAHLSTWKSRDGSCIWPQSWLVEKFPNAHVFCVSYQADVKNSSQQGSFNLHNIGENLTYDLLMANIGQEPNCPIILVGHSFGGLVIKQLCLQVFRLKTLGGDKPKNFLESIKGIFYYGTPHHGSPFMDKAARFLGGPLLKYVKSLSNSTGILNFDFNSLCASYNNKWKIDGLGESLPTKLGIFHAKLVPEASSRDGGQCFNVVEDADHFSLCKPKNKESRSFYTLENFLNSIAKSMKEQANVGEQARAQEGALLENFQHLPRGIVGIDHVMEKIRVILNTNSSLGLVGMGGIGKTTLAKETFNTLGLQYEYNCFIHEVKKMEGRIVLMKEAIVEHVYHHGKKINIVDNGSSIQFLQGKCLFLVLDDVSKEHDLEIISVLRDDIKVDNGSRFVITSRDVEVTKFLDYSYEVPLLDPDFAKLLFIGLAFHNPSHNQTDSMPPPSLQKQVDIVVKKCAGLPLTLEVVGKYLHGKSEVVWEQVVQALDTAENVIGFNEKLWMKLKLSYDGLDELEKEMFLDAATIFLDENLGIAKAAWGSIMTGSEHLRWKHLVDLSLVWEVDIPHKYSYKEYTHIGMHEQLQSLGRNIASTSGTSGKCSRILNAQKAWELLRGENHIEDDGQDVVALKLEGWMLEKHGTLWQETGQGRCCISRNRLCRMEKLRYLVLNDVDIDEVEGEAFPSTLVYLMWSSSNFAKLPFSPNVLNQLAVLHLHCEQLCTLPTSFGQLSSLCKLRISGARYLVNLPDSFGHLSRLETLGITECFNLEGLPETFGNLSHLKILKFDWCNHLQRLPETFGNLSGLKILKLSWCHQLDSLPETFGNLSGLKYLAIRRCERLHKLPHSMGQLLGLEYLELRETSLESIPNSIESLPSLKTLELGWIYTPQFPTMPMQLANVIARKSYNRYIGWTFDIVNGKFNLNEDQDFNQDKETKHQQYQVHKKITDILQFQDFIVDLEPLSQWNRGFLLQERGVLKRLKGDLAGSSEDLTTALDKYIEKGEDNYECRKHRGYVRFLMGDFDGASIDGKTAIEITPIGLHEPDYGFRMPGGVSKTRFLGRQSVEYMGFKLN